MSKPLKFRNQGYGAAKIARRNNVEYTVHYDYWKDGKKADAPYYVGIWDLKTHDNVDTGRSRRFASEQEAFDFCQDVCDGRVRLSDLKKEAQAIADAEEAAYRKQIDDQVAAFRDVLADQGVSLKGFLVCLKSWDDLRSDAHVALWRSLSDDGKEGAE